MVDEKNCRITKNHESHKWTEFSFDRNKMVYHTCPGYFDEGTVAVLVDDSITGRCQVVRINPGTHTMILDQKVFRQKAIADFVKKIMEGSKVSTGGYANEIALAVGWYEVPLEDIFGDDVKALSDLKDDFLIASIVRMRDKREAAEKNNGV